MSLELFLGNLSAEALTYPALSAYFMLGRCLRTIRLIPIFRLRLLVAPLRSGVKGRELHF